MIHDVLLILLDFIPPNETFVFSQVSKSWWGAISAHNVHNDHIRLGAYLSKSETLLSSSSTAYVDASNTEGEERSLGSLFCHCGCGDVDTGTHRNVIALLTKQGSKEGRPISFPNPINTMRYIIHSISVLGTHLQDLLTKRRRPGDATTLEYLRVHWTVWAREPDGKYDVEDLNVSEGITFALQALISGTYTRSFSSPQLLSKDQTSFLLEFLLTVMPSRGEHSAKEFVLTVLNQPHTTSTNKRVLLSIMECLLQNPNSSAALLDKTKENCSYLISLCSAGVPISVLLQRHSACCSVSCSFSQLNNLMSSEIQTQSVDLSYSSQTV
eukprot:PhF_6_TR25627/c0_g1_i2/m.35999